jgi:DNA (cytosine-5)-methyltransferase 1
VAEGTITQRHVYLTEEETTISVVDFIRVCCVFPLKSIVNLERWVSLSPDHFYIRFKHPTLAVEEWSDLEDFDCIDFPVCRHCVTNELLDMTSTIKFLEQTQHNPLKTLDLFAGVGAFTLGLVEGSGCLKLTHAIEISPSATETLR